MTPLMDFLYTQARRAGGAIGYGTALEDVQWGVPDSIPGTILPSGPHSVSLEYTQSLTRDEYRGISLRLQRGRRAELRTPSS